MGSHDLLSYILAAALGVLWLWGLIDACVRPGWAFANAKSSKALWIVLQIFDVAYIPTLIYILIIRNRVIAAQAAGQIPGPGTAEAPTPQDGAPAPRTEPAAVPTYPPPEGYSYPSPSAGAQLLGVHAPMGGTTAPPSAAVAEPVMAAQPVVATQPVAAQPVVAQPVVAQPIVAVTVQPVTSAPAPALFAAPLDPAPNWQADPTARHQLRYWDGARWTEHVADAGQQGVDPLA